MKYISYMFGRHAETMTPSCSLYTMQNEAVTCTVIIDVTHQVMEFAQKYSGKDQLI